MKTFSLTEFRPTIFFLLRFIGLYVVLNMLYGVYITARHPQPDAVTSLVSHQTAAMLRLVGWSVEAHDQYRKPITTLEYEDRAVLAVYEGCNGINTMLIFVVFVVAFGPWRKPMAWFVPVGILIIHSMNLLRISMLFFVSRFLPDAMYFVHKYLFTAFLYAVIFGLWLIWIRKFTRQTTHA